MLKSFHKWFNGLNNIVKLILLIIPVVGWICELLIRLDTFLDTKSLVHLVVFILFLLVGWGWFLGLIDAICLLLTGHLILAK